MSRIPTYLASLILTTALTGCGPDYSNVTNLDSPGTTIICFGDSNVRGYGASMPQTAFPARLSEFIGLQVMNQGKDGDTTASALLRLEKDVLAHNPRIVIIGLGGNDFLEKRQKQLVMRDLEDLVNRIQQRGAMTVILHAKFGILGSDPYHDGFKDIAERTGSAFVPNTLKGILGTPSRMADPIHPNDEGNRILAERVAKVVAPLLEQADAAR